MLTILSVIAAVYIVGAVLFAGMWGIAMWRAGGFAGFAALANKFMSKEDKPFTSIEVQWMSVAFVLFWFALPLLFIGGKK